ncbi:hypothetical protein ACLB1Q_13090 [Escherichia coli]
MTINTVSGDDIINNAEKTRILTISGGSSGLATGTTVTVMLNGLTYSATARRFRQLRPCPLRRSAHWVRRCMGFSASATDSAGDSGSTTHTVNVESLLPGVIINTVAGDDVSTPLKSLWRRPWRIAGHGNGGCRELGDCHHWRQSI